jgi:hypothetical protein
MKSAEENGQNFNNQHNLTTRNDLPIICKPGWSFSATWMAEGSEAPHTGKSCLS